MKSSKYLMLCQVHLWDEWRGCGWCWSWSGHVLLWDGAQTVPQHLRPDEQADVRPAGQLRQLRDRVHQVPQQWGDQTVWSAESDSTESNKSQVSESSQQLRSRSEDSPVWWVPNTALSQGNNNRFPPLKKIFTMRAQSSAVSLYNLLPPQKNSNVPLGRSRMTIQF